jgi:hypothetical protein
VARSSGTTRTDEVAWAWLWSPAGTAPAPREEVRKVGANSRKGTRVRRRCSEQQDSNGAPGFGRHLMQC